MQNNKQYTYDAENFKNVFEHSFTWINGFMRNVRRYGKRPAIIDPAADRILTYKELNADVNRLANAFAAYGIGQGDIVFYQLYNCTQFVMCYIAPQKLGAINSPGNFNLSAGETARMIDRDRPKAYIYDYDCKDMAVRALELSEHRPALILAVDHRGVYQDLPEGHRSFDRFISEYPDSEPKIEFEQDIYAEVTRLGTSGTTGTPKAVPLNNINEVMSAHDVIMHFPLDLHDVTMNMTPWFHRGGLHSGGPVPTLYVGASLVTMRIFSAGKCFEYVERYGITFLIGVPSALVALANRQERHPAKLSGLKGIVTMGSPLERGDCERFRRLLTENIFNGYGTTETFWNSFLRPYDLPEMSGSAGISCTDDEVRVVNMYADRKAEPDETVPNDGRTQGEIIISACGKSPLCYVKNEEQSRDKYYKGWYYTHDVGTWDENGYITIAGRRDDMIICMGENIYPDQLEEVLKRHPKVDDCMVTGVDDPKRGQAVAAYIVTHDPTLTANEMNRYCTQSDDLPAYKCPRYYAFVDSLPYNATGKKQHFLLKERAAEDIKKGILERPKLR